MKVTPEMQDRIVEEYQAGDTTGVLSRRYQISSQTVLKHLDKRNVPRRPKAEEALRGQRLCRQLPAKAKPQRPPRVDALGQEADELARAIYQRIVALPEFKQTVREQSELALQGLALQILNPLNA